MVEDLREQIIRDEEAQLEEEEEAGQFFLGLRPSQRLVLAVLLFFNVALCGCLSLVMMGRILPAL